MMTTANLPIVFLGPSLQSADAERILVADYRPPVRRGDLNTIESGRVVAIIDGVFEQDLAVSLAEIVAALRRGVTIYGGGSMGALRAAEVPGVRGVGRIYSWIRRGVITRDDEVALMFEDDTYRALTVPTVNIRYAIERLTAPGTIDRTTAEHLLTAAQSLPFKGRTYAAIVREAGLADHRDKADLIAMLRSHDLKNLDARSVLEAVDSHMQAHNGSEVLPVTEIAPGAASDRSADDADEPAILIWESGDRCSDRELLDFLIVTGRIDEHALGALGRAFDAEPRPSLGVPAAQAAVTAQSVFNTAAQRWGWVSAEEAKVTLADLSLDFTDLNEHCIAEAQARENAIARIRDATPSTVKFVLSQLFLSNLALKREAMRLGSVRSFARSSRYAPDLHDLQEARTVLCKVNGEFRFSAVRKRWARLGVIDTSQQDAFVEVLARARKAGRDVANAMNNTVTTPGCTAPSAPFAIPLKPCPKPSGEARFCLPTSVALDYAEQLRDVIGVSRVGMIGELADLNGVQVAQAARPGGAWSSSYGSGKSLSRDGAVVGSIMEEVEKWTQEIYTPRDEELIRGSYAELKQNKRVIDPAALDLPYDSVYRPESSLDWVRCADLLNGGVVYVPVDVVHMDRRKNDIAYCQRGARKCLATNGLASGFSREEALLHALCEFVERHAARIADLYMLNPGGLDCVPYRFIDVKTMPRRLQDLADRLSHHGADTVRVLNITSDVVIPTFQASIIRDFKRADGYGAHPSPEVAIEMALLEAAQTIASAVTGGREDLSIRARSLGRHERPRPISVEDAWFWLDPDTRVESLKSVVGSINTDVYDDLVWSLAQIRSAGVVAVPAIELTVADIRPAHVVRVIVPGLESNNPFYTGDRARLVLLRDLLPRWR